MEMAILQYFEQPVHKPPFNKAGIITTDIKRTQSFLSFSAQRQTPDLLSRIGGLVYELDDDLLSHGEAPHYHRRCVVSLLSSGWDQVVPTLYGRQAIRLGSRC